MKKLIFSFLLALGMLVSTEAQTLFIQVNNNTSGVWSFKVGESNGGFQQFPGIGPGSYNAQIPNFAFSLGWAAEDPNLCTVSGVIAGAGSGTTPLLCTAFPTTSVSYTCTQVSVLGDHLLVVNLN